LKHTHRIGNSTKPTEESTSASPSTSAAPETTDEDEIVDDPVSIYKKFDFI
jgi:hypothetical protein